MRLDRDTCVRFGRDTRGGLGRDTRGAAALEFALALPLLITALLGTVEAFGVLRAAGKAVTAAFTVADLSAQKASQNAASLAAIVMAARQVLAPLPVGGGTLAVSITSVGYDAAGRPVLRWQYVEGGGAAVDLGRAQGLGVAGESVVIARLVYRYTPMVTAAVGPLTFTETAIARPRLVGEIAYGG